MNTIKIVTLPIRFFPAPAASKAEDKIRTDAAVTEVRKAINAWMYSS
jgi:hypothetical protein